MEHAKKMVLVPADIAEKQQQQQQQSVDHPKETIQDGGGTHGDSNTKNKVKTVQTPGDATSRLDEELYNILRSNKFHDDSHKWKQYLQVLQRYLFLVGPKNSPAEISSKSVVASASMGNQSMDTETIIASVPAVYKRRALLLVNYLCNTTDVADRIRWDREGRVTIDGVFLPNCNIVDLVNDAVRFRKTFRAYGRDKFIIILHAAGIPREFIGNAQLWTLIRSSTKRTRSDCESTDNTQVPSITEQNHTEHIDKTIAVHVKKRPRKTAKQFQDWLSIVNT